MRILQVIPYYSWSHGGPVRVVYELSRELANRGHEIEIYTTSLGASNRAPPDDQEGVVVHRFPCLSDWLADGMKLHFSPQMRAAIRSNLQDFDVAHLHEWRGVPNAYVRHYSLQCGVPYVIQGHGAAPMVISNQGVGRTITKMAFDRVLGRRVVLGASRAIALTHTEAEEYRAFGLSSSVIDIIPNGIDPTRYSEMPTRGRFRGRLGIGSEDGLMLYLGRIHPSKGLDMLVEAFARAREESPGVKLAIAGPDDGFRADLTARIRSMGCEGDVIFTGYLSEQEKREAMADADLFVTPSFSGFPIAFLEACASGLPIITTRRGDSLDWLDGRAGRVTEFDPAALSRAMLDLLGDASLRSRCGEEGRRLVNDRFTWDKIARMVEQVYDRAHQAG